MAFTEKMIIFAINYKNEPEVMFDIQELKGTLNLIYLLQKLNELDLEDKIYLQKEFKNILTDQWYR